VRDTGEIFEFIDDVKKVFENINFFISIYFGVDAGIRDIEFSEKYKIFVECADWEIITDMKNFVRS
jgi:hypothetical protein